MKQREELQAQVVAKAAKDADFRARLRTDPKGAIEQELGVTIPAGLSIRVHEESATTAHLVLPPAANLSAGDMRTVAGGQPSAEYLAFKAQRRAEQGLPDPA